MQKIALPLSEGNQLEEHFGHCTKYIIVAIDNHNIISKELIEIEGACICKNNELSEILKEKKVETLIVNSIGENALIILDYVGINVIKGCKGDVDELTELYINKQLKGTDKICVRHYNCNHS